MTNWSKMLSALHERHPWDEDFVEKVRARIEKRCSEVPVHVHRTDPAERRLEEACREAIVEVYLEEFTEAWFPIKVRRDWPVADCIITGDEASIRYSISPEADALMGGINTPRVKFKVRRPPPNIAQKAIRAVLGRKPQERPELPLTQPETLATTPKTYRETIGAAPQPAAQTPPAPTVRANSPKPHSAPPQSAPAPKPDSSMSKRLATRAAPTKAVPTRNR